MVPNANESHLVQILVWSHCSCCSSAARLMSWCLLSCYIHGSCAAPICHALRLLCVAFYGLLLCGTARAEDKCRENLLFSKGENPGVHYRWRDGMELVR